MAKFPPTLIITGTRAIDMSPAIFTNSQLLKAGVRSTLIVGEAMGHCYIDQSNLPEARDAYRGDRQILSGKPEQQSPGAVASRCDRSAIFAALFLREATKTAQNSDQRTCGEVGGDGPRGAPDE